MLVLAVACFATTPIPFAGQIRGVDQIFRIAVSGPGELQGLRALEQIANGDPEGVNAALASLAGITSDPLELSWFRNSDVRVHAMRKIGETARPEAIAYLSSLKAADFESDATGQIWPASQVALQQALLLNIGDKQRKIEFLEKLVMEDGGYVASFAEDELCIMGSLPSLPLIAKSMRRRNPDQYGEEQVRFAEARIRVVISDPDPVKALANALKITSNEDDVRLIQWAVTRLKLMHTPEADAQLDRYASAIEKLPLESPERRNLAVFGSIRTR